MARTVRLIALIVAAMAVTTVAPLIGPELFSWRVVFSGRDAAQVPASGEDVAQSFPKDDEDAADVAAEIFSRIRLPRVAMAFSAGAALALCGAAIQAMFRNPLAEPYTLGIAGGAALGAAVAIHLGNWLSAGWGGVFGPRVSVVSAAAFVGAAAVMLVLLGVVRTRRAGAPGILLLCGVAISFCCSSVNLLLQYLGDPAGNYRLLRWVMGQLDAVCGWSETIAPAAVALGGAVVLFSHARDLNLLGTGEDLAASRGLELLKVRSRLMIVVSLMVAVVAAYCGPIGFVGLIVPHCARAWVGYDHRFLLPAALFGGGAFLAVCDTAARTVLAPAELPVGILTALLGGPFFLGLLFARPVARWSP